MKKVFSVLILLGFPAIALAQPTGPPLPLSLDQGILQQFEQLRGLWFFNLFAAANDLFWKLATLEFVVSTVLWMSATYHFDTIGQHLFRKILFISVGYAFLLNVDWWMPAIVDSFVAVGAAASGLSALSPNEVFLQGLGIGTSMLWEMAGWGIFLNLLAFCVGLLCVVVIICSFGWIAIEMAVTLMEAYLVMGAGVFLLAFAAFRGTAAISERYLGFVIAVGIKLFTIYLIIGAGALLAPMWASYVTETSMLSFTVPIAIATSAALFLMAVLRIPQLAASMSMGAVQFSTADLVTAVGSAIRVAATAAAAGPVVAGTVSVGQAASQMAGGGFRGAVQGIGAAGRAIASEAVPRLQWAADRLQSRAENIRAGKGNRP
jgi:type IV secretion system protein TrbL